MNHETPTTVIKLQDAISSRTPGREGLVAARATSKRAPDAGLGAHTPHLQAEALGLAAACDLALGEVAEALGAARRAIAMHGASGARLAEITAPRRARARPGARR
jgi:hypothetical protein